MNNPNFQEQVEATKKLAQQKGLSGVVYIDYNPANGFLRLKLKVTPPEYQSMMTSNFVSALAQCSQIFGLQVKTHQSNGDGAGRSDPKRVHYLSRPAGRLDTGCRSSQTDCQ